MSVSAPKASVDRAFGPLAGELRTQVARLAYALRAPATRTGVTPTRFTALGLLEAHPDGLRSGDLAARMGVTAPTVTRLADVLRDAGWVERHPDPADHRAAVLTLSPEGRATLERVRVESAAQLAADLAELPDEDVRHLVAALPVLRRLADRRSGHADDVG